MAYYLPWLSNAAAAIPSWVGALSSGAALLIGTNTANDVRQGGVSAVNFEYSNFQSYGGGVFCSGYSPTGAWAIAGPGGHGAPGNMDALIFDFQDATWKLLPNTTDTHFTSADFASGSADGWMEVTTASGIVPLPSHLYQSLVYLTPTQAGNTKGKLLRYGKWAVTQAPTKNDSLHQMNLDSGAWERVVQGSRLLADATFEKMAVVDSTAGRVYLLGEAIHAYADMEYLRLSDSTLQISSPGYGSPADWTASATYHTDWIDEGHRLLMQFVPGFGLRALQLDNQAAGWTALASSGTEFTESSRPAYYATTGNYYFRSTSETGNVLFKLQRPASSPLTSTWAWSTVTLTGAAIPAYTNISGNGARHYSNLIAVPAGDCIAWVSGGGTQVAVMRPAT